MKIGFRMIDKIVLADTSFYICFFKYLKQPDYLIKIINNFKFHLPGIVKKELRFKEDEYALLKSETSITEFDDLGLNFSVPLEPFFGKGQVGKGENEIIVLAYVLSSVTPDTGFCFILDDPLKRKFVFRQIKGLYTKMMCTPSFIGDCCLEHNLISPEETLLMLSKLKTSTFGIDIKVVDDLMERLRNNGKN